MASNHRPFCDVPHNEAPSVLRSVDRPQGSGSRCSSPALGRSSSVCLPSNSHHREGSTQTEGVSELRSNTDRPLLASKRLFFFPDLLELLSDVPIELPKRPDLLHQPHFHRFHENLPMLRLTAWRLKRFARQAGFSSTVAGQLALCRRTSTRLNYQARWGTYRKWCRDFLHRSSDPTIPKIAEFLTYLFKTKKAAVSTIKGYRAMLSSVYKFCLPTISTSPILKDLIKSFEISAPRPLYSPPLWDLFKVLEYLAGPPFEPLAEASFRNKTRKALFLLAMATAKRVGELQALSFSVSRRGDDLVLHYDLSSWRRRSQR